MAQILLILGMHRSGTSAFAKGMEVLGGTLGSDLLPEAPDNPKGFFEDRELQKINDDFLLSQGSHWDAIHIPKPSLVDPSAVTQYQNQVWQSLSKKISGSQCFVFKDPRMSRLWPFWIPLLQDHSISAKTLWVLRHPMAVAQSLKQRDGIPLALGLLLWDLHNRDIAQSLSHWSQVTVSSYEALLRSPEKTIGEIAQSFGYSVNNNLLEDFSRNFLDVSLNHASLDDVSDVPALGQFFVQRYRRSIQPGQSLDDLGQSFGSYPNHIQLWHEALGYLSSTRDDFRLHASELQDQQSTIENYVSSLSAELKKREEYALDLVHALEKKENYVSSLTGELKKKEECATHLSHALEQKEQDIRNLRDCAEQRTREVQNLRRLALDYKNRAHYLESLILQTRILPGNWSK